VDLQINGWRGVDYVSPDLTEASWCRHWHAGVGGSRAILVTHHAEMRPSPLARRAAGHARRGAARRGVD